MKSTFTLLGFFILLGCILLFLSIRSRRTKKQSTEQLDSSWNYQIGLPVIPPEHDASVTFQIQPVDSTTGASRIWRASYSGGGHTAQFMVEIDLPNRTETHGILMSFGQGRLRSIESSDDRAFLAALAFALGGSIPSAPHKQPVLAFDYVHFGDHLSAIPGGGFQFKPAGHWTAMKLSFDGPTEDDSATVYFSLNEPAGEGQFSMSNSDYGDPVMRFLATVL